MPRPGFDRNCGFRTGPAWAGVLPLQRGAAALLLLLAGACTRTLPIRVELQDAQAPSPRSDGFRRNVRALRLKALIGGRLVTLPDSPADQGEIDFADTLEPSVQRLVVEGLDQDGEVFSSGASGALDLFLDPPADGVIPVYFSRAFELSFTGESIGARRGAQAIGLPDGRVLFAGGVGEDGCTIAETLLYGAQRGSLLEAGPLLPDGRAGDFELVPLPNGEVVVVGGVSGCNTSSAAPSNVFAWLRFDPLGSDTRTPLGPALLPDRASAAVSEREVVIAGGRSEGRFVADVLGFRFDDTSSSLRSIGVLGQPRARASALAIDARRILLAGGSANAVNPRPLASAAVYLPQSGQTVTSTVFLLEGVDHPGLLANAGGAIWVVGGQRADGTGSTLVQSVLVRRETDASFSDVTPIANLPRGMGRPKVISVGAAGALIVPEDDGDLAFVDAEGRLRTVPRLEGQVGPLVGGALADGTVVLLDQAGQFLRFNPGPLATLGPAAGLDGLNLLEPGPSGLVPLRPSRWARDEEGFGNNQPVLNGSLQVQEVALAGVQSYGDFDLSVEYLPIGQAKAALVFGYQPNRYAYLALSGFTSLEQFGVGPAPACAAASEALLEARAHVVRLQRRGLRITIEIDGVALPPCDLLSTSIAASAGPVGIGVISGQLRFRRLSVGE